MEELEPDVTSDKPAPKGIHNIPKRKIVGIIFTAIGALGIIFFTLRLLYYINLSHATDEVLQKEYQTTCLASIERNISSSLKDSLIVCILMIIMLSFGLFLIFFKNRIRKNVVVLVVLITIVLFVPTAVLLKNKLYVPVCPVEPSITVSQGMPLTNYKLTLEKNRST